MFGKLQLPFIVCQKCSELFHERTTTCQLMFLFSIVGDSLWKACHPSFIPSTAMSAGRRMVHLPAVNFLLGGWRVVTSWQRRQRTSHWFLWRKTTGIRFVNACTCNVTATYGKCLLGSAAGNGDNNNISGDGPEFTECRTGNAFLRWLQAGDTVTVF